MYVFVFIFELSPSEESSCEKAYKISHNKYCWLPLRSAKIYTNVSKSCLSTRIRIILKPIKISTD